jgi:4-diphosphocytidyl-2-C-methyl-D-erythritol kinase
MRRAPAAAKINLALVVGPKSGARHEVTTVLQRVDLADRITLAPAGQLTVTGFPGDTLVREALTSLAAGAGGGAAWSVRIEKRIPVAAGLGGGSTDAATALRLANETLERPLRPEELHEVAAGVGADVPFFLSAGPQLGQGSGSTLTPLDLPQDYWVVLVLPHRAIKRSTAAVYAAFDERRGADGYGQRRSGLLEALASVRTARDLAALPPNDLAASPLAGELRRLGAFRADVSGAGPTVYGLFHERTPAEEARRFLRASGRTWITVPAWYL